MRRKVPPLTVRRPSTKLSEDSRSSVSSDSSVVTENTTGDDNNAQVAQADDASVSSKDMVKLMWGE